MITHIRRQAVYAVVATIVVLLLLSLAQAGVGLVQ